MNKTYVFLSHPVAGIGGAQLYVRDKKAYLEKEGYKVIVVSGYEGENIVISEFVQYRNNVVPELQNKPQVFSRNRRNKVVEVLCKLVPNSGKVIIESSDLNSGSWGELFAARTGGKNIIFCLSEAFPKLTGGERDFLQFKLMRNELYGIHPNTISLLLGRRIDNSEGFYWKAGAKSDAVDVPNEILDTLEKKDYNLGSIGRYDKPCVPQILQGFLDFAIQHPTNNINIILCIGEHTAEIEKEIENKFSRAENISLYVFGPLVPLPKSLFMICDVFVSTAGCAGISWRLNVPTITMDVNDHKAIGILGLSTQSTIYRKDEEPKELTDLLDDVLIKKVCAGKTLFQVERNVDAEYEKQLKAVLSDEGVSYYDVSGMTPSARVLLQRFIMLFGKKFYTICKQRFIKKA